MKSIKLIEKNRKNKVNNQIKSNQTNKPNKGILDFNNIFSLPDDNNDDDFNFRFRFSTTATTTTIIKCKLKLIKLYCRWFLLLVRRIV